MPDARRGWFLPQAQLLALEEPNALVVLGSGGGALGRFAGSGAEALRARLGGGAPAPLLAALVRAAPGLEPLLSEPAQPLAADALLRRGGWGMLFVELLARCNERCLHCYAGSGPERDEGLDWASVQAVLRDAAALGFGTVQLTGGEALLCPFVVDAARLAKDLGIEAVEVYTNGVLLSARRYAELRGAGVKLAFSLYARSPEVHDRVTQLEGSHALTTEAIRRAVEGGSSVRVGVIATRPEDEDEALAAAALAEELGVPPERIGVQVSRAVGRGAYAGRPAPARPVASEGFHGDVRTGKAAVLYDGTVTPCIFSRDLKLGTVDASGGLRQALEAPPLRVRGGTAAAAAEALRAGCSQLTCGDCRAVSALLRPAALRVIG